MDKMSNNILDLLFDPTKYPLEDRMYFRPEEKLQNDSYDRAVAEAKALYGTQGHNSDFYPGRKNLIREALIMDRKTLTAGLGVFSQQFKENDPIAKDLRTMVYALSKMSDEELANRTVENAEGLQIEASEDITAAGGKKKCPDCGQTLYCMTCAKGGKKKEEKKASSKEDDDKPSKDESKEEWTKKASDAVKRALIAEIIGDEKAAGKMKGPGKPDGTGPWAEKAECPLKPPVEEKKAESEEAKKAPEEGAKKAPEEGAKKAPEEETTPEVPAEKKPETAEKKLEKVPMEVEVEAEKTPKSVVDTGILANVEGVEMEMGIMTADDLGDLSAEEQKRLDLLFQ